MIDCSFLAGKKILVTGATGLIGKSLIKTFISWNERNETSCIIIGAVVRNIEKAKKYFGENNIHYIIGDIRTIKFGDFHADYIIHGASSTSSKEFINKPVEVISIAFDGTKHILEYANKENIRGMVYLSSMEVYGMPETDEKIAETQPTNINTMKVRSCYPESKRMCENLCISYMSEYNLPIVILRLTQTFGMGVDYNDERIFAEFARCAIEGRDIILKTRGETKRSYLYLEDAVNAVLTVIYKSSYGEAYNVANEVTYCSIYEMAQLVAKKICKGSISVMVDLKDKEEYGFAPTLHMNLDTEKIRKLDWKPTTDLEQMYRILIEDMKQNRIE